MENTFKRVPLQLYIIIVFPSDSNIMMSVFYTQLGCNLEFKATHYRLGVILHDMSSMT